MNPNMSTSIEDFPAMAPPPGVQPLSKNPESQGYIIFIVGSVMLVLMLSLFTVRIYTKLRIVKKTSWDDLTCTLSFLMAVIFFAKSCAEVVYGPLGKHQWNVTLGEMTGSFFTLVSTADQSDADAYESRLACLSAT